MRWIQMQGPTEPIIRIMAIFYSRRCRLDREDLIQEAWLALIRRKGHTIAVAQTAMYNAMMTSRSQSRLDRIAAEQFRARGHAFTKADKLDIPIYLSKLDGANQEIIRMLFFEEIPVVEIARRCNLSPSTINRRIQKAVEIMRGEEITVTTRYSRSRSKGYKRISKYYG